MIKLIKEFIEFKRMKDINLMIDINEDDKQKIYALDTDILDKLYNETLEKLARDMLRENFSIEFIRWAKFSLYYFIKLFNKPKTKSSI